MPSSRDQRENADGDPSGSTHPSERPKNLQALSEADLRARAERQAALAELGVFALGRIDLQTLLDEAVRRIRATLSIDTCTVLELAADGATFHIQAAVGWDEPATGQHVVNAGTQSQAGFTLMCSEPVVVLDYALETRFPPTPILRRHGIRSGMTVIILGRDRPYGVFGVQSKSLRTFSREDVDYFQAAANILASAINRLRTEEDLRQSEASFRSLIEHAPEGILISQNRSICYVNQALVSYLDYRSAADLLGTPALDVVHPDDRDLVSGRLRGMDDTGRAAVPREMRFLRRDGTPVLAESIGVPVVFNGQPALAALIRDVTERKKLEARLRLSDRLTSLGTLAAGVAHEINNPLTYVLGNLDFMRAQVGEIRRAVGSRTSEPDGPSSGPGLDVRFDDLSALIEGARDGGERVRRIVSDLKSVSRTENEEKTVHLDVRRVMDSSLSLTRNEIRHRAQLVKEYGDAPLVMASESRLGQVFLNLLVNAAQAIPDGAAHAHTITVRTYGDALGRAIVEVQDTGTGITPEIQNRLFDPFFTTKPLGVGTGLGLSICHNIVTDCGGELTVDSEVGKGSTFRVALPPAKAPRAAEETQTSEPVSTVRGKVLIIDDEPFVAGVCRRMLAPDHDVDVTTAAQAALARLESGEEYDVILCDLMMPEMSGMELYDTLAARAPRVLPRIVFLSGGAFSASAGEFRERVPNLFLDKPCDPALLRSTVGERVRALQSRAKRSDEKGPDT